MHYFHQKVAWVCELRKFVAALSKIVGHAYGFPMIHYEAVHHQDELVELCEGGTTGLVDGRNNGFILGLGEVMQQLYYLVGVKTVHS